MKCKLVAITGLIGSGKSAVGSYLRERGFCVVDCDEISRKIAQRPDVLREVEQLLGSQAVVKGTLNRQYIRSVVFGNKQLLDSYNAIFHGKINQEILQLHNSGNDVVFVEVPLMDAVDIDWYKVWNVTMPEQLRLSRASVRDGKDIEDIRRISAMQKIYKGDCAEVVNDGDISSLNGRIDDLLNQL